MDDAENRVRVRVAGPEDEVALAGIEAVAWTSASAFPSVLGRETGTFFTESSPPDAHLVAEVDGVVVGYVRIQPVTRLPENAHVRGITGIAVAPGARHQGIGSALLAGAERHVRDNGGRKLSLRVLSTNDAALRVYERAGFVREGTLRAEFRIDGRDVDDVLMTKHLGEV